MKYSIYYSYDHLKIIIHVNGGVLTTWLLIPSGRTQRPLAVASTENGILMLPHIMKFIEEVGFHLQEFFKSLYQ